MFVLVRFSFKVAVQHQHLTSRGSPTTTGRHTPMCHRWFQLWEDWQHDNMTQCRCWTGTLKLTWKWCTSWNGSHIFPIEPLSKTGYLLGVCHGLFNLHGPTQAARSTTEHYKMKKKKYCPERDSNSRPLDFVPINVNIRPWDLIYSRQVQTEPALRDRVFFVFNIVYVYNLDIILLFDQYLLVKLQTCKTLKCLPNKLKPKRMV